MSKSQLLHFAIGLLMLMITAGYGVLVLRAGLEANAGKDFSQLWLGGRMLVAGRTAALYDPEVQKAVYRQADPQGRAPAVWTQRDQMIGSFFYPPMTAAVYSTLSWLPLTTASVVNGYLNIGFALLSAWFLSHALTPCVSFRTAALAILVFPACFVALALGQNALASLAVILAAWHLCSRRRDLAAGLVLGLLVLKPNWLLAVAWIPLIHGRWRLSLGVMTTSATLVAGTAVMVGLQPFHRYLILLDDMSILQELPAYNLALTYNGVSLFRKWLGVAPLSDCVGWCSSLLIIMTTWRLTRGLWRPGTADLQRLLACSFLAAMWVNPHLFYYDLTLTVPAVTVMVLECRRFGTAGRLATAAIVAVAYAGLPWDQRWSWGHLCPVPTLATLSMWLWFVALLAARSNMIGAASSSNADLSRNDAPKHVAITTRRSDKRP